MRKGIPFTTYIGETHPGFWAQVLRSYTCAGQWQTLEFWCHIPLENQRVVNSTCPSSWENPRNRLPSPRLLEGLMPGNLGTLHVPDKPYWRRPQADTEATQNPDTSSLRSQPQKRWCNITDLLSSGCNSKAERRVINGLAKERLWNASFSFPSQIPSFLFLTFLGRLLELLLIALQQLD